jgi:pimeloyl-ACP methyl ester carboxylesterase
MPGPHKEGAPAPRAESLVTLPGGRRLGYGEFGDAGGPLVLWFPGTPGGRRQLAPAGRRAADELGLRVVCVERPGIGFSSDHTYRSLREWAADAAAVADHLGRDRFLVVGFSGGGPYALACAHELPDRVVAAGLLGSLVPTAGDEAAAHGVVSLARPFNRVLTILRRPMGLGLWSLVHGLRPLAHQAYRTFGQVMPEGDRRVLDDPYLERIFIDDLVTTGRRQFQAMANDLVLLGRPWGFSVGDVAVPVRWWHGDVDPFVGLDQALATAARLPDVELYVRPGESHLGGFAASDEVLRVLAGLWRDAEGATARAASPVARPPMPLAAD